MGDNYCFNLSGMPCLVSAKWLDAEHGGHMVKGAIHGPPSNNITALPVIQKYQLQIPWTAYNPSVCTNSEELLIVARVNTGAPFPRLFLGRWVLDHIEDGALVEIPPELASGLMACGGQDVRPFMLKGILHGVAAVGSGGARMIRQAVIQIDSNTVKQAWLQPGDSLEKNWMPCSDGEALRLIYSADPLIVFDFNQETHCVTQDVNEAAKKCSGSIRGGSQLIPYQDGWLAVIHEMHYPNKIYTHKFVAFDQSLTSARFSQSFYFNHLGIEFCAGLAFYQGKYIVSYGVNDSSAWFAEVTPETVEALLAGSVVQSAQVNIEPIVLRAPQLAVQDQPTTDQPVSKKEVYWGGGSPFLGFWG